MTRSLAVDNMQVIKDESATYLEHLQTGVAYIRWLSKFPPTGPHYACGLMNAPPARPGLRSSCCEIKHGIMQCRNLTSLSKETSMSEARCQPCHWEMTCSKRRQISPSAFYKSRGIQDASRFFLVMCRKYRCHILLCVTMIEDRGVNEGF